MQKPDRPEIPTDRVFAGVMVFVILLVLLKAGIAVSDIQSTFEASGNDDVMRLVAIRDWLDGQGWFDTTQYRLVPPEGVVMHWSRYLDAAIATIIVPLSWMVPMETAEMWAVAIWPTLLMLVLVLLVGFGTRRIFGAGAGCFAMGCAVFWPFTSDFYFSVGRIDHHNVQVLMLIVMTLAAIWPSRAWRSGIVAGLAAAFSLAIGLEYLSYVLALGLLLLIRAIFHAAEGTNQRLLGFCCALAVAAVGLWLGQTAPSRLLLPVCDQLGTPILSLIGVAVVASLAGALLPVRRPWLRLAVSAGMTVVGCVLAWPLLGPCLVGPYALLPETVQEIISGSITEALPAAVFALRFPLRYNDMMTPVVGTMVLSTVIWWLNRHRSDIDPIEKDIVGQLWLLGLVGVFASFWQIRLLSMSSAAVLPLAGYGLWTLFRTWRTTKLPVAAAKFMLASVVIIAPFMIRAPLQQLIPAVTSSGGAQSGSCRDFEAMSALNDLPPGPVLNPMNLGPSLLLTTHHTALAGPYHRSSDAYVNGIIPFEMLEAEMKSFVRSSGATYLLLCRGSNYGKNYATELAKGNQTDWVKLIDIAAGNILVFEVLSADLNPTTLG